MCEPGADAAYLNTWNLFQTLTRKHHMHVKLPSTRAVVFRRDLALSLAVPRVLMPSFMKRPRPERALLCATKAAPPRSG